MGLGPSLSIRQSQQLVLTPQLTQAIKLLQLSNLELDAFIAEELSKNPLLESPSGDDQGEAPAADSATDEADSGEAPDDPGADDLIRGQADDDRPLDVDWTSEALETDSFSDVVMSSGGDEAFDFDRIQYSAGSLAEHLQDQLHGLSGDLGDLARAIAETLDETGYLTVPLEQVAELTGAPLSLVENALSVVQGLEPPGIGARSLGECLASAGWLVKALDQRARTIVKVVSEIVKRQQGFFERGVSAMKPLTLREVAEAIEMHESTVSRVTSNKYLLCDRGLYELKYFFGSGVASAEGDGAAAEAVKAGIKEVIDAETEILSDDAIAGLLKQRGFDVARRTVVKYREAMGIGSSIQRRRQRKMTGVA